MSEIEWTDTVWNPVLGCSRVSAGCQNCYAERFAHRGLTERHRGLTVMGSKGPRWTGEVRLVPEVLGTPLKWRKPRRVFVNSMSDLFHDGVPFEFIAAVFGVMAAAPQHTFQVLTKRPRRMREFFEWAPNLIEMAGLADELIAKSVGMPGQLARRLYGHFDDESGDTNVPWPLPNVWLGVSVEDQATADERIPLLLECPAAVRWVSYEPALGPVDFDLARCETHDREHVAWSDEFGEFCNECAAGDFSGELSYGHWLDFADEEGPANGGITWVVVGGESGPGARPFDIAWARSVVAQCKEAGTACFVKQLGTDPRTRCDDCVRFEHASCQAKRVELRDRKGGDMSEWPEDLRVRQWPGGAHG